MSLSSLSSEEWTKHQAEDPVLSAVVISLRAGSIDGRDRALGLLQDRFYWVGMAKDIERYVKTLS